MLMSVGPVEELDSACSVPEMPVSTSASCLLVVSCHGYVAGRYSDKASSLQSVSHDVIYNCAPAVLSVLLSF